MSAKPRILILTLSFGAGHVSAARAIAAEFKKQIPDAEARIIDALADCPRWFRAFYVWTYQAMIRYAPRLWDKFFKARLERGDEQTAPVWMWRRGCRQVFEEIRNFQPQLIVAAEVGASEIAVIARRDNLTHAEIVCVITDYEAEPIWVKPEISTFAVSTEKVKKQLTGWGAGAEKIHVCGIPLKPDFAETRDLAETRTRFGLDERPLILLMGGGTGPTRMDEVAARLLRAGEKLQIIALPGRDETARAKLKKLSDSAAANLQIINWTEMVAPLMRAADILATKPGGVTLSEAAASGVPLVLFDAIPGPEVANAEYFVGAGAAVLTKNSEDTASEILRLLGDDEKLHRMSAECRKLARPDAAAKIVEAARRLLNDAAEDEKRSPLTKKTPRTGTFSASGAMKNAAENFDQSLTEVNIQ